MFSEKYIYTVMTMTKLEESNLGWPEFGSTRVPAWYSNREDAISCVRHNWGDIWEYTYDYAMVEKVGEGLYPYAKERWFFKFNENTKEYEMIDEPKYLEHICNISMG